MVLLVLARNRGERGEFGVLTRYKLTSLCGMKVGKFMKELLKIKNFEKAIDFY